MLACHFLRTLLSLDIRLSVADRYLLLVLRSQNIVSHSWSWVQDVPVVVCWTACLYTFLSKYKIELERRSWPSYVGPSFIHLFSEIRNDRAYLSLINGEPRSSALLELVRVQIPIVALLRLTRSQG